MSEPIIPNKELTRSRLFYTYVVICIATILFFSVFFLATNAGKAVPYLISFVLPFVVALYIYRLGYTATSIGISITSSITVVLIQTFVFFGNGPGFHFQYLALLVVCFLVSDMSNLYHKILSVLMSLWALIAFMFSEAYANEPIIGLYEEVNIMLLRHSTLVVTFLATSIMLYVYSKQLSVNERSLLHLASHDSLTNIYNRRYFVELGRLMFEDYKKHAIPFSVILMDIDDFKDINDTYGHHAGDKVLVDTTTLIQSLLPQDTKLFRYGGEEFTILLPNMELTKANDLAETIRRAIENSTTYYNDKPIRLTASFGVTITQSHFVRFDNAMVEADKLLYKSKLSGKNQVSVTDRVA